MYHLVAHSLQWLQKVKGAFNSGPHATFSVHAPITQE